MKERICYDRRAAGARLKAGRRRLGWSRAYTAGQAGLAEKYYADIERGYCGMSIETLLTLAKLFGMTLDEVVFGKAEKEGSLESVPESGKPETTIDCGTVPWEVDGTPAGMQKQPDEKLPEGMEELSPEEKAYCSQMVALLVRGMKTGKEAG